MSRTWGNRVRRRIGVGSGVLRSASPHPQLTGDSDETAQSTGGTRPDPEDDDGSETVDQEARPPITEPDELRTVDVELIWTRFEKEGSGTLLSTQEGDDATLSVCLVISWPPHELVDRAADFTSTGDTLRSLIDLFENLRGQKLSSRPARGLRTASSLAG